MSTRIYLVTDRETQAKRLIRAGSQAQAIRHAVQRRFEATVAGQDDLVQALAAGSPIESAVTAGDQLAEQPAGDPQD